MRGVQIAVDVSRCKKCSIVSIFSNFSSRNKTRAVEKLRAELYRLKFEESMKTVNQSRKSQVLLSYLLLIVTAVADFATGFVVLLL